MIKTNQNKLHLLALIVLIGLSASILYHYIQSQYLNKPYPYTTFLSLPNVRFTDFFVVVEEARYLNPYLGQKSGQYPFLSLTGFFFSLFPSSYAYYVYFLLISASLILFSLLFLWNKKDIPTLTSILIAVFLSYPFLFAMDRGNFESLLLIYLLGFAYFYQKKRFIVSSIFLALATALKLYPVIFFALFIPEKKLRELFVGAITTALLTILSLACFKGGFIANLTYILSGANVSNNEMFTSFASLQPNALVQRGVSLYALIKILNTQTGVLSAFWVTNLPRVYTIVMAVLIIPITGYIFYIEKEFWKRTAILVFVALLFPQISGEYKLLHIFVPLFLFLSSDKSSRYDILYIILFALLLIPKDYYYFPYVMSDMKEVDISNSLVVNIAAMLLLSFIIVFETFQNRRRNAVEAGSGPEPIEQTLPNPGESSAASLSEKESRPLGSSLIPGNETGRS